MANNYNNLVKGLSMRQKLQNSKGYPESPELLPALGLFSRRSLSLQLEVNQIPSPLDYNFFWYTHTHTHIYMDTKLITLPCWLACVGKYKNYTSKYNMAKLYTV